MHRSLGPAICLGFVLLCAAPAWTWTDVSSETGITLSGLAIDPVAGRLLRVVRVENRGASPLEGRLRLVVEDSVPPVVNGTGWDGQGNPSFELPALAPGEATTLQLAFPLVRAVQSTRLRVDQLLPPSEPLEITSLPSITRNPTGLTPLVGLIEAETNVPARATLRITDGTRHWMVSFGEFQREHALELLGLLPDRTHRISLSFEDAAGGVLAAPDTLTLTTAPLPSEFPEIEVLVSDPERMEPGYTLIDRFVRPGGRTWSIIFDARGEVVWYGTTGGLNMVRQTNGRIGWLGIGAYMETDLLGNSEALPLLTPQLVHHDLFRTLHGTFLSLGRINVEVDGYPTSLTDPDAPRETRALRDEGPIEFDAAGNLIGQWPLVDVIDPTRVGYGSLNGCEEDPAGRCDWVHTNAVIHDPLDDSLLVSARHQDAVVKISRETGELRWILGNHFGWAPEYRPFLLDPVGDLQWPFHQHAITITPEQNLLMFDNGNAQATPFDGQAPLEPELSESRAVEYRIDEETMQIEQVWEFRFPYEDRVYARFISDADWMPQSGNRLINFGGTGYIGGASTIDLGLGEVVTRLVEVTGDTPSERVFDMMLYDPAARVQTYRAERIPRLYPPQTTMTPLTSGRPACGLLGLESLLVLALASRQRRPAA